MKKRFDKNSTNKISLEDTAGGFKLKANFKNIFNKYGSPDKVILSKNIKPHEPFTVNDDELISASDEIFGISPTFNVPVSYNNLSDSESYSSDEEYVLDFTVCEDYM